MAHTSILISNNFDNIESDFTKLSPFKDDDHSIKNTIECLTISFKYYYDFICSSNSNEILVESVKDHSYSIYLKSLMIIIERNTVSSRTKNEGTLLILKKEEKNELNFVLNCLSNYREFFLIYSKSFNYLSTNDIKAFTDFTINCLYRFEDKDTSFNEMMEDIIHDFSFNLLSNYKNTHTENIVYSISEMIRFILRIDVRLIFHLFRYISKKF